MLENEPVETPFTMDGNIYWHSFLRTPGLGQQGLRLLAEHFGDGEAAWNADAEAYREAGVSETLVRKMMETKRSVSPETEYGLLSEADIDIIADTDPEFPALLREIPRPPLLLYTRGTIKDWNTRRCVSIVGSRKYTNYGRQAAEHIAEGLAHAGFTVVSGLAFGIDRIAHEAALRAGGETVAVLADSLDDRSIAPQSHLALAREVTRQGSLLSEYPPVTAASPWFFPARNRFIAGISLGTVVIEAAEKSGSLITASLALDFDRDVFAVPGSIFSPASSGTNELIRNGATIVRNISDIIGEFSPVPGPLRLFEEAVPALPGNLSRDEETVFRLLSHEALAVDEIIKSSHLGASAASSAITMLELKGLAKNIGRNHYIRT